MGVVTESKPIKLHGIINHILIGLDVLISLCLVTPLVVGFWCAVWTCMDVYEVPWYYTYISGTVAYFVFALFRDKLVYKLNPQDGGVLRRLVCFLVSRLYTLVFGYACVSQWRGAWLFLDECTGLSPETVLPITAVCLAALTAMKTLRSASIPPFSLSIDDHEQIFDFPTRFRVSADRETWLYVLDCLFSVLVVGTLVVFVWRGAWTILEIYLFPGAPEWSAFGSLALGYAIVFLTFSLQTPLKGVCGRLEGFWRVCVVDIYLFFSFCGTVNLWRGVWNLLNLYFLSDTPVISYWVTHIACLLLLILLNCSNSVLVRGVYIDAEEEGGKCVVFPCYYLRLIFQTKRREKLQQLQMEQQKRQLVAATRRKSDVEKGVTTYVPETNNHVTLIPSEVAELLT